MGRGNETETSRIIKKLTAKDLAESLADLMERYNNLESKSIASKECSHCTKSISSEPIPNTLQIPKTPNYANHNLSPTNSMRQRNENLIFKKIKEQSSSNETTTNSSTISSLSPERTIEKSQKQNTKKKLFAKISHAHKFHFKSHKNKNKENKLHSNKNKNKMTQRGVSHYSHYINQRNQQQHNEYHHEYFHHAPPYSNNATYNAMHSLPFSHIRSNPDHTNEQYLDAPKNRFARSKSTETPPFQAPNQKIHHYPHNPYFIAYTPSTITPPIPSPNHAPIAYEQQQNASLLDVLLSAPSNHEKSQQQKKRSHPYKKRAINSKQGNNHKKKQSVASILTSRTNLTQSPSHSAHSSNVPTYPQQYVPNKKNMIDPIIEYSYSQENSYTNSSKRHFYAKQKNKRKYNQHKNKYHHHHYQKKTLSNTKSQSIFSEIEGKNDNKTKSFYHPKLSASNKLKLSHNNAYSQPLHHQWNSNNNGNNNLYVHN